MTLFQNLRNFRSEYARFLWAIRSLRPKVSKTIVPKIGDYSYEFGESLVGYTIHMNVKLKSSYMVISYNALSGTLAASTQENSFVDELRSLSTSRRFKYMAEYLLVQEL